MNSLILRSKCGYHNNILLATFKMVNLNTYLFLSLSLKMKGSKWLPMNAKNLDTYGTSECAFDQQYFHKSAQSLISGRLPPIKISTGGALRSGIKGNARKIQVHQLKMIELISSVIFIIYHLVRRDQLWFISWVMWLIMTICFFGDILLCPWRM